MAGQNGASLQMDKDILDALKRIIRIGVVQSFDAVTRKGRVKFEDKCNDLADNGHDPGNESADNRNNSRYKIRYGLHDLHDNRGRLLYAADNSRYHIGHDHAQHLFRHLYNVFRNKAYQAPDRASYGLGGPYEAVKNRCSLRTENAFYLLAGRVHVAAGKYVLDRVPSRRYSRNDLVKVLP